MTPASGKTCATAAPSSSAITARDVEHARNGTFETPAWLNADVIAALKSATVTFRQQNVEAIGRGPVEFLLAWIQNPDVEGHRVLANRLPFLFFPTASQLSMDPARWTWPSEAALRLRDPDRVTPSGEAPSTAWWWSAGRSRLPHPGVGRRHGSGADRDGPGDRRSHRGPGRPGAARPTAGASGCASPTRLTCASSPRRSRPPPPKAPGRPRTRRSTRPFDTTVLILMVLAVPRCRPRGRPSATSPSAELSGSSSRNSRGWTPAPGRKRSPRPSSGTRRTAAYRSTSPGRTRG